METLRIPEFETYPGMPQPKPDEYTVRQKIEAVKQNSQAGFLATTQREKTDAFKLLSYSNADNTDIICQDALDEIFQSQKKLFKPRYFNASIEKGMEQKDAIELSKENSQIEGYRGVVSIVFEWSDYLKNANRSLEALILLRDIVRECPNPRVKLMEEVDRVNEEEKFKHQGYKPLVRYMDLIDLMNRNFDFEELGFGPLYDYEMELPDPKEYLGFTRRKAIEDEYSSDVTKKQVYEHFAVVLDSLKIGGIREVIEDAVTDQENRVSFWTNQIIQSMQFREGTEKNEKRKTVVKEIAQLVLAEHGIEVK